MLTGNKGQDEQEQNKKHQHEKEVDKKWWKMKKIMLDPSPHAPRQPVREEKKKVGGNVELIKISH